MPVRALEVTRAVLAALIFRAELAGDSVKFIKETRNG